LDPALLFERSPSFRTEDGQAGSCRETPEEEGFQAFTFEDPGILERPKFTRFLESLPPSLFRCKGWVRFPESSVIVNYSGGNYRLEPTRDSHPTALVLVGRKCPQDEILESLKKCVIREPALVQIQK
jgi:G3E family GTPase